MKNNKFYNIITVGLILLMAVISSLSLGMSSTQAGDNDLLLDGEDPIVIVPEDPSTESPQLPADAGAYDRLAYAINIYYNGAGFTSIYTQSCLVMGNDQTIYAKKYRGNGFNATEEWFKMNGVFSSFGKNEFMSYFVDNKTVYERAQKNLYDYDKKTYTPDPNVTINQYALSQWTGGMKKIPVNALFTTLNESTTSILSYDNKGRGKDYYTIKLAINTSRLDDAYLEIFRQAADSYNIKSMVVTLKISKQTGYLISYEREDLFDGTTMGFTGSCEMRTKEFFTSMNVSAYPQIKNIAKNNFNVSI